MAVQEREELAIAKGYAMALLEYAIYARSEECTDDACDRLGIISEGMKEAINKYVNEHAEL